MVPVALITVGWHVMVTSQSLFSILDLASSSEIIERSNGSLCMIITGVFPFHFPTTVMTFGACQTVSRY